MIASHSTLAPPVLIAVDIAKLKHEALVELPDGRRRRMTVRNQRADFHHLADYLRSLGGTSVSHLRGTNLLKNPFGHDKHIWSSQRTWPPNIC